MSKGAVKLAPSILAADFARLGEQVKEAEKAGADRIHVDVMDGHFVPNISIGAVVVQSLRPITRLHLETPASALEEILQDVDQVLVMTVNPGFGGQHFIATTVPKIRRVRQMIEQVKPGCELEVDGGIDPKTAPLTVEAGANVLVAGSAVFNAKEGVAAAMQRLQAAVEKVKSGTG